MSTKAFFLSLPNLPKFSPQDLCGVMQDLYTRVIRRGPAVILMESSTGIRGSEPASTLLFVSGNSKSLPWRGGETK